MPHDIVHPSLDLMNEPVRQLLFTKPRNSLNRIENYNSKVVYGAGICSLNRDISLNQDSLNQDSLNQDLSVTCSTFSVRFTIYICRLLYVVALNIFARYIYPATNSV